MGLDFVRKAAKSFNKSLDQSRVDLGTPNLFTQQLSCEPRVYAAEIKAKNNLRLGDEVSVCLNKGEIVALKGMDMVAVFLMPPANLVEALKESHGEAYGVVKEIHDIADTAEITIC